MVFDTMRRMESRVRIVEAAMQVRRYTSAEAWAVLMNGDNDEFNFSSLPEESKLVGLKIFHPSFSDNVIWRGEWNLHYITHAI